MYQKILVPVDLGDKHSWRKAIPTAVTLCETFDGVLIVMTVIPDVGMPVIGQYLPQDFAPRVREQISSQLKAFIRAQVPPGIEVRQRVAAGKVYQEIIQAAAETEVDLIVMASHHPGLKNRLLGPNAAGVVQQATKSVMVVRD